MTSTQITTTKSGRFLLRMPPSLHATLEGAARASGLSLNEYCLRRLASGGAGREGAPALLRRASTVLGGGLNAVVLHGSVTRGDDDASSDVDALLVVDRRVRLGRALYRAWDEEPLSWNGRAVDPHFVHPPKEDAFSGLWAEVALDGEVLFDRDGWVFAHLVRVRQAIADGRLARRFVHGQPYWKEAP